MAGPRATPQCAKAVQRHWRTPAASATRSIQIIDAANAVQRACTPPGASSVSNDGVSMTFTSGALAARLVAEAAYILANTLGSDPHNLLYRGCF